MSEQLKLRFFDSEYPCSVCAKPIRTIEQAQHIYSEYMDGEGRCWDCAKSPRSAACVSGGKRGKRAARTSGKSAR